MGMIRAEKLVFEYDKRDEDGNVIGSCRAIDGVDIDIPQGSFVAVLGHNGSGKSTLAKHMNAILVPTDGTMWVDGKDTKDLEKLWGDPAECRNGLSEPGQPDHRNSGRRGCRIRTGKSRSSDKRNMEKSRGQSACCRDAELEKRFSQ